MHVWNVLNAARWKYRRQKQQQQQQLFYDPLSGNTRVSRYQKKHSPTHHPDHHPIFISFFHLPRPIVSSLFKLRAWQSFCTTSFFGGKKSPKIYHLGTIAQLCRAISSQLRHVSTMGKKPVNSNISPTCPHSMVKFGPLVAKIGMLVSGTPATFSGFRFLAALLHDTRVVGVSQSLRRWTQGATYIRKGGHHVGHWPTF